MILFVVYAVAVWVLAFRDRRSWRGLAWLTAGLAGLLLTGWLHYKLQDWTTFDIYLPVLQVILYPYALLVMTIGVFLYAMPRPGCRVCGYDLVGAASLDETIPCPECGTSADEGRTRRGRRAARRRLRESHAALPAPLAGLSLSGEQRPGRPDQQHQHRDAERHEPAQG